MSAITDTPERERSVDFITYFSAGAAIVVQRGNPAGITDLAGQCGHTVAVEESTTQVDLLARSQKQFAGKPIRVKTYDTNADALLQLRTGRANAVLNATRPRHISPPAPTRAHYQLASTAQCEPGPDGIAVAKNQPRLRDPLQAALAKVIASGEYRDVLHHWGVADGALNTPSRRGSRPTHQLVDACPLSVLP